MDASFEDVARSHGSRSHLARRGYVILTLAPFARVDRTAIVMDIVSCAMFDISRIRRWS